MAMMSTLVHQAQREMASRKAGHRVSVPMGHLGPWLKPR
jgi:hypothetical protein